MNKSFKKSWYIRALAMEDIEQTLGELKSIILLEPDRPHHFNGEAEGVKDLFEQLSIGVEVWVAAQEKMEQAIASAKAKGTTVGDLSINEMNGR